MKILLINMKRSSERLALVDQQLSKLSLGYERIEAVDGTNSENNLTDVFHRENFLARERRYPTLGEAGCAKSHRLCWELIVKENLPYGLILEDDVDISLSLPSFIEEFGREGQFDFLNLSSVGRYNCDEEKMSLLASQGTTRRPCLLSSQRNLWRTLEPKNAKVFTMERILDEVFAFACDPSPALGSGYIVSQKAAACLLKSTEILGCPIDKAWRYTHPNLKQGFTVPSLIKQCLSDSTIDGRDEKVKLTMRQKMRRFFMKQLSLRRKIYLIQQYGLRAF